MKKIVLILMMASLFVLAACGANADAPTKKDDNGKKTLVMGTSADYPPFESVDTKTNKIVGFDIDVANYITKKLGYNLEVKDQKFGGLIAALNQESIDFVMSGMVKNEERAKQVDFSDVYYTSHQVILVPKDSKIKTAADLKGKKVGVQIGSTQATLAEDLSKKYPMDIEQWDKVNEMVEAMAGNKLDAIVTVDTVAFGYTNDSNRLAQFNIKDDSVVTGDPMSIAFPKGSKLTAEFNKELKKMEENGELDKFVKKWIETSGK